MSSPLEVAMRNRRRATQGRTGPRRKPPSVRRPEGIRLQYERRVTRWLERLQAQVEAELFPTLKRIESRVQGLRPDGVVVDEWPDDVERSIRVLERWVQQELFDAEEFADEIASLVSSYNYRAILNQVKASVGVDLLIQEPWLPSELASWAKENARLIRTIPTRYLDEIEGIAMREFRAGKGAVQIARDISERYGVSRRRAAVIARDQVGKLNGQLTEFRHREIGVREYIWRTTGQVERMRDHHAEREGRRYRYDDPPWDGHPGEAIQCMCWAEPIFPSPQG